MFHSMYNQMLPERESSNTKSCTFSTNEYVNCGNLATDIGTGTASCWFKTSDAGDGYLMARVRAGANVGEWRLWLNNGTLEFRVDDAGGATTIVANGSSNDGNWHHVVVTWGSMAMWIDGVKQTATASTASGLVDPGGGDVFSIGANATLLSDYSEGPIDECAIWSSIQMGQAEIDTLYNSGKPTELDANFRNYTSSDKLFHLWKMGDGDTSPTIVDHGSEAENGTFVNMDATNIITDIP